ncbi:hypothetical protein, partial [Rathayibacter rathayi]|uniref:hypothetical protein n=2 Tax=Rathayibacter rathayi TaxID=33887 RepID=UPI003B96C376
GASVAWGRRPARSMSGGADMAGAEKDARDRAAHKRAKKALKKAEKSVRAAHEAVRDSSKKLRKKARKLAEQTEKLKRAQAKTAKKVAAAESRSSVPKRAAEPAVGALDLTPPLPGAQPEPPAADSTPLDSTPLDREHEPTPDVDPAHTTDLTPPLPRSASSEPA